MILETRVVGVFQGRHGLSFRFAPGHVQTAPGIQGVVDLELALDIFQIIRKAQAVAHGDGLETGRQGIGLQSVGVGGIDDLGHPQ